MKKIIAILVFSIAFIGNINANDFKVLNNETESIVSISNVEINPELVQMMKDGVITSLTISNYMDYSCTLSAEVSYNGAAVKMSITADNCEAAGAGLAQAVRGFMKEMQK